MFSQMGKNRNISALDCSNVADVGGTFTCSLEELEKLADQASCIQIFYARVHVLESI